MEKEDAIKYLQELHPQGGHCWLDKQRIETISMAVEALKEEPKLSNLETVGKDLEEASKNYALNNTPWDDCKDEIQESFKAGAEWGKNQAMAEIQAQSMALAHGCPKEPITEDLGEYINELSKQFTEVSFAKLSRIAVRVAKWQKEQINEVLLSEVLPCFMHGGEADEVVAKLEEVLNKKK